MTLRSAILVAAPKLIPAFSSFSFPPGLTRLLGLLLRGGLGHPVPDADRLPSPRGLPHGLPRPRAPGQVLPQGLRSWPREDAGTFTV